VSQIQRDYIERLIQQCADFLSRIVRRRDAGEPEPDLREFTDAADRLLGPLRPVLEKMEASTAVSVAGPFELDRVRMYAALVGEESLIHRARGDSMRAYLRARRALELYAAVSLAGGRFDGTDLGRLAVLTSALDVDVDDLDPRYGDELRRLAGRGRRPH
jgi:hypothetical protein